MLQPENPFFPASAFWTAPGGGRTALLQEGARLDTAGRQLLPPRYRLDNAAEEQWMDLPGWGPVPAHRVLRENVQHRVLQGDRMVEGVPVEEESPAGRADRIRIIIALVLLVLALAAAAIHLYHNPSGPQSVGTHWFTR